MLRFQGIGLITTLILCSAGNVFAAEPSSGERLILSKGGQANCSIVVCDTEKTEFLIDRSVNILSKTIEQWGGAVPEVIAIKEKTNLPEKPSLILGTLDCLRTAFPEIESLDDAIRRAVFIDDHGFVIVPAQIKNAQRLLVVSKTSRGVYNGVEYLRDFYIDGPSDELFVPLRTEIRSPAMGGRAVYLLTIWNQESQDSASDWTTILDSFARDGLERVYFWMSGHFPSKKFPQTYNVLNKDPETGEVHDRTADSKIGTIEDQRRIIKEAHNRGLKLYLGGGLAGWSGAKFVTNLQPDTFKQPGPKRFSLCPSHPLVRRNLVEYYTEMFDALPEADGVYIESADEEGPCKCVTCDQLIGEAESRQFGRSQLTLMQEMAASIWKNHPHARFAYTIGYGEHLKDPAYYRMVREMSADPRWEWMEARNSWSFPGPESQPLTPSYFSPQVMHWNAYEWHPMEKILIEAANKAASLGMYGMIGDFSPGFGTGSFYNQIPFPTDILPYVLTGFVIREMTWEPTLSLEAVQQRVREGFFGKEAPDQLAQDFWSLREIVRASNDSDKDTLNQIEQRLNEARPNAGPKTLESIGLMQRAIDDTRENRKISK